MKPLASNSGYELLFTDYTVVKACSWSPGDEVGKKKADRLAQQASLQRAEWDRKRFLPWGRWNVPRVVHEHFGPGRYQFAMERVHGSLIFDLSHEERAQVMLGVLEYVQSNLQHSQTHGPGQQPVRWQTLHEKLNSVVDACLSSTRVCGTANLAIKRANSFLLERWSKDIMLPLGRMHGDYTLCNVVCRHGRPWLIDFLDGFISSPVLDLAKLRQDTRHGWIRCWQDVPQEVLDELDAMVVQQIEKWPGISGHVPDFTLLALLRALPYAREQRVIDLLVREIERCTR